MNGAIEDFKKFHTWVYVFFYVSYKNLSKLINWSKNVILIFIVYAPKKHEEKEGKSLVLIVKL